MSHNSMKSLSSLKSGLNGKCQRINISVDKLSDEICSNPDSKHLGKAKKISFEDSNVKLLEDREEPCKSTLQRKDNFIDNLSKYNEDSEKELSETLPLPLSEFKATVANSRNDNAYSARNKRVSFDKNESFKRQKFDDLRNVDTFKYLSDPNRIVVINNKQYIKLSILGKGGSSTVYRVISTDLQNIFAYKRVEIKLQSVNPNDDDSEEILNNYINEISLLKKLKGSKYIIELIDFEINKEECYIAILMEAGDTDLAKVLNSHTNDSCYNMLSPLFIRMIWQEMLEAVNHIHKNRIVHGDLKPANFVFVKGHLKLIDFGIAKVISNDTTNIYRESQIGTVNYMAPEAISPTSVMNDRNDHSFPNDSLVFNEDTAPSRMKLGKPSDIWSLGCILYQIVFGKPPYANLSTIQKIHAISNSNYSISYPEYYDQQPVDCIKKCLKFRPIDRIKIEGEKGLLNHSFLKISNCKQTFSPNQKTFNLSDAKILKIIKYFNSSSTSFNMIQDVKTILTSDYIDAQDFVDDDISVHFDNLSNLDENTNTKTINITEKLNVQTKPINNIKVYNENISSNISKSLDIKNRKPLKLLPMSLQQQILNKQPLDSVKDSVRATKWMVNKGLSPEKEDLKSILEKRIGAMRKFLEVEHDNTTNNEFTEGTSFF